MKETVNVIGAGLAGVEAVNQLVKKGYKVKLYEMRPKKMTPAHHSGDFCELVCSNSLRADGLSNAVGVLKYEMELLDSVVIKHAREHSVPAGGALAVDREGFSKSVTDFIKNHPLVEVFEEEITKIPTGPTIIASGPLTSDALASDIASKLGNDYFYFFDAAAPIITKDSVDFDIAYYKSRYDKGENEYINCPMNEEEFNDFYEAVINGEVVKPKDFEEKFFEGCMPFEEMARRGNQTLLFGPMKPVGLTKPDGTRPHAVVQLRQDDAMATLYNIVGFQTHLTWSEQKKIIQMIPGLQNAEIIRYGVMHRNSFICSPKFLTRTYQLKEHDGLFFAGQITGVEGYVESIASGFLASISFVREFDGKDPLDLTNNTALGALMSFVSDTTVTNYQPMNINFGLIEPLGYKIRGKQEKNTAIANRSLLEIDEKALDIKE